MSALLALASAASFGVGDFLGGLVTRKAHVVAVTLLTNLSGAAVSVILMFVIGGEWTAETVAWSAAGGLCGLAGLVLLYSALAVGPNKLVSPLSAVVAAAVPVMVGISLGDRPGRLALIGLVLIIPAVWFLAGGELAVETAERRTLLVALGAGLGFGSFFALLAQVPDGSGAVPLLTSRLASLSILVVAFVVIRPKLPAGPWASVSVVAGGLDMTANGLFLWATRDGELAVVGALVNLFPATTVLMAVIFLGERLTRTQLGGLVLALGAAMLLS